METNYHKVLRQIEEARRFGKLPGVEVTARMLGELGEPQRGLPYIHVAGTNGKGSVCAYLDRILRELGFRTGRFTSPHLVDFAERIAVDGALIGRADIARLGGQLLARDFGVSPTMFDYCLAMAVLYFQEQHCEIAVIETGLGGRLDSTNALGRPEAAVITRIGYDHMAVLGSSLAVIAGEKAGILKAGVPSVFAPQEPEAMEALLAHDAAAHVVSAEEVAQAGACGPGLLGLHQYENAAAAAAAVRVMWERSRAEASAGGKAGFAARLGGCTPEELEGAIARGIRGTRWPGRMELLSEQPFFLVDGAHNSNGVAALRTGLEALWPGGKFCFAMGVMADKDYEQMAELLLPLAEEFVTVTPESVRALRGEELAAYIRGRGVPARCVDSVQDVCALPAEGKRTVAFGSLYFIGDILGRYRGTKGRPE